MSIWSKDPEWFDQWLERQAEDGRFDEHPEFGSEIKALVAEGDFCGWLWWNKLDTDGKLGMEAMQACCESRIP